MIANGITVKLTLSEDTYRKYEEEAKAKEQSVERILEDRLWRFEEVRSAKPVIIDDEHRRQLDSLLGRNLQTPQELVLFLQRALAVKVDNVRIALQPALLERLHSRAIGMTFEKFMNDLVIRHLEEYSGLR